VIALWLLALLGTGIVNIATYDPTVFRAYNPGYAISFVYSNGIAAISGVLLAVTGVEALFADLGHYNRQSIQWTLTLFIYPVLVVTYLGQAAALTVHPEWVSNAFYNSIPGGVGSIMYWVMFVLASAASVVASQAMILGIFSVVPSTLDNRC
jgi:KUP system potassium uptake protein